MQSEQLNELAGALAKAQGAMTNATMNRINPHFKSKYADLASVLDASRKPLSENGLSVVQTMEIREGGMVLRTMLMHVSGQWIASEYPLPATARPQEMGSAQTYARRYSLAAIICNSADEDDDAEAAEDQKQRIGNGGKAPQRRHDTLPKKDARDVFAKLQKEIAESTDHNVLKQWGEENKERVNVLPPDWQDILRLRFHERIVELRQLGADDKPKEESTAIISTTSPEKAIEWIDAKLSLISDGSVLQTYWNDHIGPRIEGWFPPDQAAALDVYRKHEERTAAV